jgi:hypothetical protein
MRSVLNKATVFCTLMTALLCVAGCRPQLIADKYRVESIGDPGKCLYFVDGNGGGGHGRVDSHVVSVGWDDAHVIVKQKPQRSHYNERGEKQTYMYFIIEHIKDNLLLNAEEIVVGPLFHSEFESKCRQMGVSSNLNFSVSYW